MKNHTLRTMLSLGSLLSVMLVANAAAIAAPVRFQQVVQVVNAKPGKANAGGFTQLRYAGSEDIAAGENSSPSDDDRKIVTKTTEIVEDTANCDCDPIPPVKNGFPKWPLFGLAAIPVAVVLLNRDKDDEPTPTPPISGTPTPTPTTPTPTPTTPTPTPNEPVPEPMTLLLFGTGLAGIGIAARKGLNRRRREGEEETEE